MNRIYAMCAALLVVFAACQKAGDNSDYDFGDYFSDTPGGSAVEEGPPVAAASGSGAAAAVDASAAGLRRGDHCR